MSSRDNFSMKELMLEVRSDVKELKEVVTRLEEQQRITNGRVSKSEDRIRFLEEYKWQLTGGLIIVSIIVPFIIKWISG